MQWQRDITSSNSSVKNVRREAKEDKSNVVKNDKH